MCRHAVWYQVTGYFSLKGAPKASLNWDVDVHAGEPQTRLKAGPAMLHPSSSSFHPLHSAA